MKKFTIVTLLAMLSICSLPAASAEETLTLSSEGLRDALAGFHGIPDEAYWLRMAPEPTRAGLIAIAEDTSNSLFIRARALIALAYFPDASSRAFLERNALSGEKSYLRSSAVESYGRSFGGSGAAFLEKMFDDENVMVRLSAVRSLSRIGGETARAALLRGAKKERSESIRSVYTSAVATIR